jgi:hypothetical protein
MDRGVPRQDLVIALDDADRRILYGRFFAQEGSASSFAALDGTGGKSRAHRFDSSHLRRDWNRKGTDRAGDS